MTTKQFTVGEKVKIVNVDNGVLDADKIGREGIIEIVEEDDTEDLPYLVRCGGWGYWLNGSNIELLENDLEKEK